jgi:hypothetical protein
VYNEINFKLPGGEMTTKPLQPCLLSFAIAALLASPLVAAQPGQAAGTATADGNTATLAFAASTAKENLFDDSKKDTIVVLADRALGDTAADDEVALSLRARGGELFVLVLRLDGEKLVNVGMCHKGLSGIVLLPGAWFHYTPAKAGGGTAAGSLKLATREFDGHFYSCAVEFVAAAAAPARPAAAEEAPAVVQPAATLPPATTSTLDPKSLTPLLVQAMMQKDEAEALKLIKLGADPNGRDQYGVPVLNWAVMMCQPAVVKALVDAKASLTYQRAPGMTIMQEAGACPEAAKILRAAGAR